MATTTVNCPTCTFENHPDVHFCEACHGPMRAVPIMREIKRTVTKCAICTFECSAGDTNCPMCRARLGATSVRACSACTCENHIRDSKCVACGMELPEFKNEIKMADVSNVAAQLVDAQRKVSELADQMAAMALVAAEEAERREREAKEAKGLEGVPGVGKCPRCSCPLIVLPGEMNCTIFICAVARSNDRNASTQLPQHNEAAAAQAKAAGQLVNGCCGGQFRWDGGAFVACTGR